MASSHDPAPTISRTDSGQVLREFDAVSAKARTALKSELEAALGTCVDFSERARTLYATDASNYRQVPVGVIYPRSRDDVVEAVRICREHDDTIIIADGFSCREQIEINGGRRSVRIAELLRERLL